MNRYCPDCHRPTDDYGACGFPGCPGPRPRRHLRALRAECLRRLRRGLELYLATTEEQAQDLIDAYYARKGENDVE